MKFEVSTELSPGVYRAGVGIFRPGETLELPDVASKEGDVISANLIPLSAEAFVFQLESQKNEEARKALIEKHKNSPGGLALQAKAKGPEAAKAEADQAKALAAKATEVEAAKAEAKPEGKRK